MKYYPLHVFALLTLMVSLSSCSHVKSQEGPGYSAREFFDTTSYYGNSINRNQDAILVSHDKSGVFNLYKIPLNGGPGKALSESKKDSILAVSWFPQDDRILYRADEGGNELFHLYVRELSGEVKDLTPGKKIKARFLGWSSSGDRFFVSSTARDGSVFDLYEYDSKTYAAKLIFQNDMKASVITISPDGRWLALLKIHSNANNDIYLVDLKSADKTPTNITPHNGDIDHTVYAFSPDSKRLTFGTNGYGEFANAVTVTLPQTGKSLPKTQGLTQGNLTRYNWDVQGVTYSKKGGYKAISVNEDASTKVDIIDLKKNRPIVIENLPEGNLTGLRFASDDSFITFYLNADTAPANLYTYHFGSKKLTQLTSSLSPKIDQKTLVESQVVRFKSFDEVEIPGILFKPKAASVARKSPVLIYIHGGPGGQSRKGYNPLIQHLLSNGYGVFAVNNRGSSGYGKTFFHLDDRKHGDHDLKDIVYGKKYLLGLDWVNQSKIAVIGGSYGGFLTLAAMAFTNEFEAGINIFGVTNWVRTLNSIPKWWASFRKSLYAEMGDPSKDEARLRSISPLFHADKISKPVLIVQGANDPRVLKIESDEIVAALKKNAAPVEYVLFEDEGHGFLKKKNRIAASEAYLRFLNEHLPLSAAKPLKPAAH
ncbi:MAG: S9 family peptidase [Pseudobacteriovorax sp.]|nr:S9 family peptidase [Pseudobacteriovorax sp.]